MLLNKKGFTLIELLVVIAIIAVLVSIVMPIVGNTTIKAQAATDAANLRAVYAQLNIHVINGDMTVQEIIDASLNPTSRMDSSAQLHAVFDAPGFVDVYYVTGNIYYGMEFLSEVATNGPDSAKLAQIGTSKPTIEGGTWYVVSGG